MNYREALAWLFGTQLFGIKLGLENIQRLLAALSLPSPDQRFIHVAGTNGKGSVCAMIDSILRAQGYRSGAGLTRIRRLVENWEPHPTFFEIVAALALQHFSVKQVQFIVLETGMGGRLDATNAMTPIVSVITPIDLDHQKWLGHSLGEIAAEKAGIIKPKVPVVSSPQTPEAKAVLKTRASACDSPIEFVSAKYESSPIALRGEHQKQNAALALAALAAGSIEVSQRAIADGLANVSWPARFQFWNDRIVIDGAHNPAGARVLAESWRANFGDEKAALILGLMRDKNAAAIYRALEPIADSIFLPRFRGERVLPPEELAEIIRTATPSAELAIASSIADALRLAEESPRRIIIAGSLHLAGEGLAHLRGAPMSFDECAQ